MADSIWTPKKIAKLKELWDKGLSTAKIGEKLGVTKNAIVGKVHRLALDGRPSPIIRKDEQKHHTVKKNPAKLIVKDTKKDLPKENKLNVKKVLIKEKNDPILDVKNIKKNETDKKEKVLEHNYVRKIQKEIIPEVIDADEDFIIEDNGGVLITELKTGMCRWPVGDPRSKDFHFCGRPIFRNKPYCLEHTVIAYTPKSSKEKKDAKDQA